MGILDSLSKNPSAIVLAALGIGLFIFRDKISDFFSNITGGAATANILGENLLSNLQGTQDLLTGKTFQDIQLPSLPDFNLGGFFTGITDFFTPKEPLTETDQFDFSGLEGGVSPPPTGQPAPPFSDAAIFAQDFPEPFVPVIPTTDFGVTVAPSIAETVIAPFTGAGISFEGGTIFETPIENLSLSQIIDKFMVTASQAADIKAQAIGFTPEQETFLSQGQEINPLGDLASQPQVSDPQFQGLTPEQIFLQLVGGNISNF